MRTILQREYDLLAGLLGQVGVPHHSVGLCQDLQVEELQDGGMGSLRFHHGEITERERRLGAPLIEGQFYDDDGTLVSLAVNLDDQGRLYELDLWKVDFSPTGKFPEPKDVAEVHRVISS